MHRTRFFLLSLATVAPVVVLAQGIPPDAGRVLQEQRPAPALPARPAPQTTVEERPAAALPSDQRVMLQGLRISGATAIPEAELQTLVADAVGKELTLSELDALALRITRRYREAGYLVARAYLPPQEIKDGIVVIAVQEGRIGQVDVRNAAGLAPSALAPVLAIEPGLHVTTQALEGSLLALSELPGVEVKSTLRPGATVGAADLLVEVAPGPAVGGSVDFDNFGNRYSGANRLGGSFAFNNPLSLGDQLTLRVQATEEGTAYGRIGYQLPFGASATRVGVAWSDMHYRLGREFAPLQATGEASVGSAYLLHPFFRGRNASLTGQVQFDGKRLVDRVGATNTRTEKTVSVLSVGLNGSLNDSLGGGGANTLAVAVSGGRLALDAAMAVIDEVSARTEGGFTKLNASASRLQGLTGSLELLVSLSGQWANKNLDSSEKFLLGGPLGVRAYPQGEVAGDEGHLLNAELRWRFAPAWQAQLFYDEGKARINHSPWIVANNGRRLAGWGLGLGWREGDWALQTYAAWKAGTGEPVSEPDRSPRVWLQLARYF